MQADIRLPVISASDPSGKLMQIQSYLYQLVQDLNYIFSQINENGDGTVSTVVVQSGQTQMDVDRIFASLKTLIIRSQDIINAYYEQMYPKMDDRYVQYNNWIQTINSMSQRISDLENRVSALENANP